MPHRRSIVVFACLVLLSAVVLTVHKIGKERPKLIEKLMPSRPSNNRLDDQEGKETPGQPCAKDIGWLAEFDIQYPFKYAEREIVVRPVAGLERKSVTKIDETLFSQAKDVIANRESHLELRDCKPALILDVPVFPTTPVNASKMVFGMATTLERLEDSQPHIARWLAHTRAELYVVVLNPEKGEASSDEQVAVRQGALRDQGMAVTLVRPLSKDELYTESYFSLVKVMYTHRTETSSWFVLMDDDTFFPSMQSLLAMLDKYDPTQQYWVGAVSEMWWSVARYGMMAFGGAGIFLSRALAAVLDEEYETCTTEMHPAAGGDERVMRCIYGHTETKLTNEPALHQMDIFGDLSGVYESGRLPLSLHHWKGGDYPVNLMSLVSDVCGDCFLQRWQFGKDTILSNGYSIAQYPEGEYANGLDFRKAEETWDSHTVEESVNPGTWHSMSPSRPRLELDKQKIQHRLLESAVVDGGVRQTYIHRGKEEKDAATVLVLYWKKEDHARENTNTTAP
ncbi:MAG: hypothetical protein LQ338_003774 [Usnochroma carphineum]|nr:MAG: hypothetical protein LQ338_003774 [Usnochroma carphineum]